MRKFPILLAVAALLSLGARSPKLSKDQQVIHALSRLTFGPRPGDVETVTKMGVKKWIDLQLHPERIPENPELAGKLAPLESLRLSQLEAERHYPNPQMIRAIASGRQPMPEDPVTRAAVERVIRRVNLAKTAAGNIADNNVNNSAPLEPAVPLDQLLTRDQIRILRTGSLDQKREVIASVQPEMTDAVAMALPPGLRTQLLAAVNPELRRKLMLINAPQQLIAFDLSEAKLQRAILSNRQLEEQLVDFWYNHFNVFLDKGADRFLVPTYEREAIRPHVLGRFRDLLEATAKSPAMLFYLDNWESVGPAMPNSRNAQKRSNAKLPGRGQPVRGLNENYARELMELHTLGVDGGYTQKDVTEVARCFTGWTIRQPQQGGDFFYNDRVHDKGAKIVLGVTIPAGGGQEDGEKVLDILAKHPSTARFISKLLAQRFVADDPPPKLIGKMAKTFREKNGDIREVMKTMLASDEFFSQAAYRAKMKSPLEMIVSAVRATGAQVDFAFPLANQIAQMGEPLYRKLEPTGYANTSAEWINSAALLARMNFALALAQNKQPGVKLDVSRFSADPAEAARQVLFMDAQPETLAAIANAAGGEGISPAGASAAGSVNGLGGGLTGGLANGPPNGPAGGLAGALANGPPTGPANRSAAAPVHAPDRAPDHAPAVATITGLLLGSPDFQRR